MDSFAQCFHRALTTPEQSITIVPRPDENERGSTELRCRYAGEVPRIGKDDIHLVRVGI